MLHASCTFCPVYAVHRSVFPARRLSSSHRSSSVSFWGIEMGQYSQTMPANSADEGRPVNQDSSSADANRSRRHFLTVTTVSVGVAGLAFASIPFLSSLNPSAKARAVGGPVTVNLALLEPGEQITTIWRGRPVWVLRRTQEMLERMKHDRWILTLRDPDSSVQSQQPAYAANQTRSIRPEYFVAVALCTHLGCVPLYQPEIAGGGLGTDWMGGYFCPCHGSKFDLAGRVTKNVPAPTNLVVPPHRFLEPNVLEIGVDSA